MNSFLKHSLEVSAVGRESRGGDVYVSLRENHAVEFGEGSGTGGRSLALRRRSSSMGGSTDILAKMSASAKPWPSLPFTSGKAPRTWGRHDPAQDRAHRRQRIHLQAPCLDVAGVKPSGPFRGLQVLGRVAPDSPGHRERRRRPPAAFRWSMFRQPDSENFGPDNRQMGRRRSVSEAFVLPGTAA